MTPKIQSRSVGKEMESLACRYLQQQNLVLIERNYACKLGEIDLIMRDNDFLVFVEVRFRRSHDYGLPIATVSNSKRYKLLRTASYYLQQHQLSDKIACRFDIIAIWYNQQQQLEVDWVKSAFGA